MRRRTGIVFLALVFEGGLALVALGIGWLLGRSAVAALDPTWPAVIVGVIATAPLMLGLWWGLRTQWPPARRLLETVDDLLHPVFASCTWLDLAAISLFAGLGEEILFRGLIQPALGDQFGSVYGLLAASTLFGLAHLITPTYAVLAAVLGLYLGGLVIVFDNLLPAIVVHALYDFVALTVLSRRGGALPREPLTRAHENSDTD